MNVDLIAWLTLRAVYAWMFLYPVKGLITGFSDTVNATALLFPWQPQAFTIVSILGMVVGALSILLGIYSQIGALILLCFNLGGAVIHYRLKDAAQSIAVSAGSSTEDVEAVASLKALAAVGHVTSAQKNFVLAAVAFFFMLMGTGPSVF
jgi:uncharacterized membrane protein YphA (DoxX/SURF4 family)